MKSDISTLKETYVLDPRTLDSKEKHELLELFNTIVQSPFPSISEQLRVIHPARRKIDQTILKIIGFSEDETEDMLNYLYPALHSEIDKLRTLMEG